jgi:hypothetical protein
MNPMNIEYERFIVAVNANNQGEIYGFGQLRPLATATINTRSTTPTTITTTKYEYYASRDPNKYDSKSNSISPKQLNQDELMEDIWEEFENDDTMEFPNGLASLPWTKEYRQFVKYSKTKRERNEERMKQLEQEEQKLKKKQERKEEENATKVIDWELASIYTVSKWRNQGIGSEIVRKLLAAYTLRNPPPPSPSSTNNSASTTSTSNNNSNNNREGIYLLTLDKTKAWYQSFGFEQVLNVNNDDNNDNNDRMNMIPSTMKMEMMVGNIITAILGEKLICMKLKR